MSSYHDLDDPRNLFPRRGGYRDHRDHERRRSRSPERERVASRGGGKLERSIQPQTLTDGIRMSPGNRPPAPHYDEYHENRRVPPRHDGGFYDRRYDEEYVRSRDVADREFFDRGRGRDRYDERERRGRVEIPYELYSGELGRDDGFGDPDARRGRGPPDNRYRGDRERDEALNSREGFRGRDGRGRAPDVEFSDEEADKQDIHKKGGETDKTHDSMDESEELSEEQKMQQLLGFGGFTSTKGKKVPGTDVSAVKIEKKRTYRQYMNRRGGFNRNLSPTR